MSPLSVLAAQLVSGTLVTAAGPHAGDKSIDAPVPRLQVEIVTLVQLHAVVLMVYLALLLVTRASRSEGQGADRRVIRRLVVLLILVAAQALVGRVQYAIGVPAALVAIHVAGAAACTAATSALWASMRERTKPEPVQR